MAVSEETWRKIPLYYAIIDELERRGGVEKDVNLYRTLRSKYSITFSEFLQELMKLEMQGIVYVAILKEDLRNVKLLRRP